MRFVLPLAHQTTYVQDYECTEPGQTHVARDGWKSFNNAQVNCVRCGTRLWLNVPKGWFSYQLAYHIEEDPI